MKKKIGKKHLTLALATLALAWLVLPTGDPSDILITLPLIGWLGFPKYLLLALAVFLLFLNTREG